MNSQNLQDKLNKLKSEKVTPIQKDVSNTPDPIVPNTNVETKEFPIDTLPKPIQDLCLSGHHALQLPYEYFAVPALVVTATAMGNKYRVAVNRSMETYPVIYACLVANAGSGKSPAQSIAFKPINSIQKTMQDDFSQQYSEWRIKNEEYKIHEKQAKKKNEVLNETAPEQPVLRELYTTDATIEALAVLLQKNPEGIVIKQDELLHLYNNLDAYRGKGGDLQFYLSLWNSESSKINRVSKPPLFVKNPVCNIIGAMTPSGINKIAEDANTENGFMDRFLFSYPTDMGMIKVRSAGIDEEIERNYHKLIKSLYENGFFGEPESIKLSHEAQNEYENYNDLLIGDAGKNEKKCSINSKILMYSLRFALIVHTCGNKLKDAFEYDKEISLDSMRRGIQLAEYFRDQTRKIYAKLNESEETKTILKAIKFIKEKSIENKINRRDLQRGLRKNIEELTIIIDELIQRKIIAVYKTEKAANGQEAITYTVNPKLKEVI